MHKIKSFTLSLLHSPVLLSLSYSLALLLYVSPPPAFAQPTDWTSNCYYVYKGDKIPTIQGLECIFANISRLIIPVSGLIMFAMLIIGSLQLLTSAGDPKQTQKAGKTLTFAIVGIIVIVAVWFILRLISTLTGVDVTIFKLPGP